MLKSLSYTNNVQLSEMSKKKSKTGKWELILHNDDSFSFEHVMTCLVEICGHNEYQANQCAMLVDVNGKCSVFVDNYENCHSVWENLVNNKLTVTVKKRKRNV